MESQDEAGKKRQGRCSNVGMSNVGMTANLPMGKDDMLQMISISLQISLLLCQKGLGERASVMLFQT